MARIVFPDNTVLCNFAAVDESDLLLAFLRGDGRWTQAIYAEARKSLDFLPAMAGFICSSELGEPIEVTDVESVERIRRVNFGGTSREPLRHLGEAETCYVLENYSEFSGSMWLTDDRDAYEFAKERGIRTLDTCEVFLSIVADGDLTPAQAHSIQQRMLDADRAPLRTFGHPDDFR
ncbi:hypothetical protein GCM10027591_12930 [Zhihengliuella somnathii]